MTFETLNGRIVACKRCPRLIKYCEKVASKKRRAYVAHNYWGKPVPNFGDKDAWLLIVGLAPAAHGGNRTGRIFTGDRSGDWLFRALYKAGFASQPTSTSKDDGLKLMGAAITAVAHCAPPGNKPLPKEIENCREWFINSLKILKPKVIVALGGLAWKEVLSARALRPRPKFEHGKVVVFEDRNYLIGSYHPSQQNTFTGKLTEPMLDSVFEKALALRSNTITVSAIK